MKLTELVQTLVAKGVEVQEPNSVVRVLVDGPRGLQWFRVESVIVDFSDESIVIVTVPVSNPVGEKPAGEGLEHWP